MRHIISILLFLISCQNKIEPNKISEGQIPSPTTKTLIYLSTLGFPGWQIMSLQENHQIFRVSTGPFDVGHNWSPDKQWIIYTRGIPPQPNLQIWKMKYNGDAKMPLTPSGIDCQTPSFSPDGKQVAFAALIDTAQQGVTHIVIINADGSGWQQITTSSTASGFDFLAFTSPSWFPDGTKLLLNFVTFQKGDSSTTHRLGIFDLGTGRLTSLETITYLSPWLPNLSPSGDKIAFVSGANGGGTDIFTVKIDGTDLQQLTDTKYSLEPDWSSDGKQIAYSERGLTTETRAIRTMNADGSDKKTLIPAPENGGMGKPRW
jgi:Tol biopolymer transport system component